MTLRCKRNPALYIKICYEKHLMIELTQYSFVHLPTFTTRRRRNFKQTPLILTSKRNYRSDISNSNTNLGMRSDTLKKDQIEKYICKCWNIICICYLDVNWLIPKISACRARIWSLRQAFYFCLMFVNYKFHWSKCMILVFCSKDLWLWGVKTTWIYCHLLKNFLHLII
jgi:hypothetical protein